MSLAVRFHLKLAVWYIHHHWCTRICIDVCVLTHPMCHMVPEKVGKSHSCHNCETLTFPTSLSYGLLTTPKKRCIPTWPGSTQRVLGQYLGSLEAVRAPVDPRRRFWDLSRAPSTFLSRSFSSGICPSLPVAELGIWVGTGVKEGKEWQWQRLFCIFQASLLEATSKPDEEWRAGPLACPGGPPLLRAWSWGRRKTWPRGVSWWDSEPEHLKVGRT